MLSNEKIQQRKAGLGGGDIAAALGLHPYKSPLELCFEKQGLVEPADLAGNDNVHFGNVLEDVVADEFSRRTGLKVRRNNQLLAHKEHNFLLANIDRAIVGKPLGMKCGLECKTADKWAFRKPDQWGDGAALEIIDGELKAIAQPDDQVPDWYLLQCVHYMAVTDSDLWFLAVLVGGNDFRIYTIKRDLELEAQVIRRASAFWFNHVMQPDNPPEPTTAFDLELLYSVDNGASVDATPDIIDTWAEIKELQAQLKAIETRLDGQTIGKTKIGGLKNRLRAFIGENAEVLLGSEGKPLASWKSPKTGRKVLDQDAIERDHPGLLAKYTKKVPGSRVLLIK